MIKLVSKKLDFVFIFTLLLITFLILMFGRNFSLIKVFTLPGYIIDFALILLALLQLFYFDYWKKFFKSNYLILIYFLLFFVYYLTSADKTSLDLLGKDFILLIYPILIYLLTRPLTKKVSPINIVKYEWFLSLYSVFLICDFILDRTPFIKSFLVFNFAEFNLPWINLLDIKITELTFFLVLLVFITLNSNSSATFFYILPGIFFGFAIYESRTVFMSLIFFILFNLFYFKNKKIISFIFYLLIGFIISLTLNFKDGVSIKESMDDYPIDTVNAQIKAIGFSRLRINTFSCLYESFFGSKIKSNCEVRFENSFNNPLPLLSEVENGFNNNLFSTDINAKYKNDFTNELYKIDLEFASRTEYFNYLNKCSKYSNLSIFSKDTFDCDENIVESTRDLVIINQHIFDAICISNVDWRLNLWKAMVDDQYANNKALLGYGVGFSIPEKLISNGALVSLCYEEALQSNNGLRSGHNTFLTLIYRFGIINLIVLSYFFLDFLKRNNLIRNYSLLVFIITMSMLDPLLESAVTSIPFWLYMFYYFPKKDGEKHKI